MLAAWCSVQGAAYCGMQVKYIKPIPTDAEGRPAVDTPGAAAAAELKDLAASLEDTQPAVSGDLGQGITANPLPHSPPMTAL